MALVTCPECGKQNVSDAASACPECGFPIKTHFEKIRAEEARKKKAAEVKQRKLEEENRIRAEKEVTREERQKEAVLHAEVGIFDQSLKVLKYGFFVAIFGVGAVFFGVTNKDGEQTFWVVVYSIAAVIAALYAFNVITKDRKRAKQELEIAKTDVDQYEDIVHKRELEEERIKKEQEDKKKKIRDAQHPVCPNCGSKNTHRISVAGRAVSVGTLGIASSTIGKQYKCDDCKHMW